MGVKDLNDIIHRRPINQADLPKINYIIIDGSNMIITYLFGSSSNLFRESEKTIYNSINHNMIYQMKYIIKNTKQRTINILCNLYKKYNPLGIYFVNDPPNKLDYNFNDKMQMSKFMKNILLENNSEFIYQLKSAEQESRKNSTSKKEFIKEKYDELTKKYGNDTYANIFRESFHYMENCNVITLRKIITNLVYQKFNKLYPNVLHIIDAEDEADLVIKNIGESLTTTKENNVMICSADSDYSILFSNNPNIYITGLHEYDKIYHPLTAWRDAFTIIKQNGEEQQIIPDKFIYNYVIRLAPLFGNDYNRETIISAKDYENCLKIFYPYIFTLNNKKSNINKMISYGKSIYEKFKEKHQLININSFDKFAYKYIEAKTKNAINYLFSVCLYSNYEFFGKYKEINEFLTKEDELKIIFAKWKTKEELNEKCTVYDMINANKYKVIHKWKNKEFIDNKEISLDDNLLVDLYKKTKIKSNYSGNKKINYVSSSNDNIIDDLLEMV